MNKSTEFDLILSQFRIQIKLKNLKYKDHDRDLQ